MGIDGNTLKAVRFKSWEQRLKTVVGFVFSVDL